MDCLFLQELWRESLLFAVFCGLGLGLGYCKFGMSVYSLRGDGISSREIDRFPDGVFKKRGKEGGGFQNARERRIFVVVIVIGCCVASLGMLLSCGCDGWVN
jgi:hypothetical protein